MLQKGGHVFLLGLAAVSLGVIVQAHGKAIRSQKSRIQLVGDDLGVDQQTIHVKNNGIQHGQRTSFHQSVS